MVMMMMSLMMVLRLEYHIFLTQLQVQVSDKKLKGINWYNYVRDRIYSHIW
jgi:hypothetical protein